MGFEVLARWNDPVRGIIGPLHFIPLMERHGLVDQLTRQIIYSACVEAKRFSRDTSLAFNLSPTQFREAHVFDLVLESVEAANFPLDRIEIEMTETALLDNDQTALAIVERFKSAGICVALDDFGTGYASLSRLHAFPFDKLKVDASFVRTMDTDIGSRKIVASVIGLGQSLGMSVVAEGVETAHQADLLRRLGCDIGQGWHFGKPMSATDLPASLKYAIGSRSWRPPQASLLQKFHQLEALYKKAPIALGFLDPELRIVSVNQRLAEIFERPSSELKGKSIVDNLRPRQASTLGSILNRIMAGRPITGREYISASSGRSYRVTCETLNDDAGDLLGLSIAAYDTSERRAADLLLKADAEHFRRAIELSPNVTWAAKPNGEVDYMSPTLETGNLAVADRISDWYGRMHAEDRARVRAEWLGSIPSQMPFATEFRMKWCDGEWRWVSSKAKPFFNAKGELERWYGVISDITDRKALEEYLAKNIGAVEQQPDSTNVLQLFR